MNAFNRVPINDNTNGIVAEKHINCQFKYANGFQYFHIIQKENKTKRFKHKKKDK